MQTMKLTEQQSLRIAELPEDFRVIGLDDSTPFVRNPTGQILRIQRDGHLIAATIAAKRRIAGRRADESERLAGGVQATTPYTSLSG
jgi:hypothetical protein